MNEQRLRQRWYFERHPDAYHSPRSAVEFFIETSIEDWVLVLAFNSGSDEAHFSVMPFSVSMSHEFFNGVHVFSGYDSSDEPWNISVPDGQLRSWSTTKTWAHIERTADGVS